MDSDTIIVGLKRFNVPHDRIAKVIGRERTAATKMLNGTRRVQADEIGPLSELIAEYELDAGEVGDQPTTLARAYVEVEVLPTYAGLGGGGTGDSDRLTALLPRDLVEDDLRARPGDLLVIHLRGDSMEPVFFHGDQVVIDKRDRNPAQPGPFALWDGDGYVVKNVEKRSKRFRVFSANPIYSDMELDPEDVTIMGRPVWFARRM